jgi:hypothetical protein
VERAGTCGAGETFLAGDELLMTDGVPPVILVAGEPVNLLPEDEEER